MAKSGTKRVAYSEIALEIRDHIHRGEYTPGQRMPTLVELAKKYGVSHSTIRLAFQKLAADGLLNVHQGKGTFVAPPKQGFNPTEIFSEQFGEQGRNIRVEVIDMTWHVPHRDAAEILEIPTGEQVWSVFLLHHLDGLVSLSDVIDIPRNLAEYFLGDSRKVRSIYRVLCEELGYTELNYAVRRIDLMSEGYYDDVFGTPRGTTFYEIRRVVSCGDKPLMMSYMGLRSDKFHLDLVGTGQESKKEDLGTDSEDHPGWKEQMHERFIEISS